MCVAPSTNVCVVCVCVCVASVRVSQDNLFNYNTVVALLCAKFTQEARLYSHFKVPGKLPVHPSQLL